MQAGFFAAADGSVCWDTVLEEGICVLPFAGGLGAEASEIAKCKEYVLVMRIEEPLHEEVSLPVVCVETEGDDIAFSIFVYCLAAGEVEEVGKRFESRFFKNVRGVFGELNFVHVTLCYCRGLAGTAFPVRLAGRL